MYKWIIIGGGIQGCCVARRLLEEKVDVEELLVIDPYPEPMKMWRTLTEKIGMPYLRSPSVHHLDTDPYSLRKYSKIKDYAQPFKGRYDRPHLEMFNQHSLDAMERAGVGQCWRQGTVNGIGRSQGVWNLSTSDGRRVQGERVVLAMGVNQTPLYPEWASKEIIGMSHVFNMEEPLPVEGNVVIVGGGMTAAHLANTLSNTNSVESTTLVKRHPFRIDDFDSDPGWLGPKYLTSYDQVDGYEKRRSLIKQARHKGSITRDLHVKLNQQVSAGKLTIYTDDIIKAQSIEGLTELQMKNGYTVSGESLVLATGSESTMPGSEWIQPMIDQLDLPCAPCGFPIVQSSLEWKDGLFVAGALAELEIGPVARNIAGARKAAERIVQSA